MKKLKLFALVLFFTPIYLDAQDCSCCTPIHNAFDFWLGEWRVEDTAGTIVGENSIKKLEENCILSENWKGALGGSGKSYNYFDFADSTWNQLWIDNKGNNLQLKGKPAKDKMVLKSGLKRGRKGIFYDQITWSKVSDDRVIQLWERMLEDGTKLSTVFKGVYIRKK